MKRKGMKTVFIILLVTLCILSLGGCGNAASTDEAKMGEYYKQADSLINKLTSELAAEFRDIKVTMDTVEYYQNVNAILSGSTDSPRETAEKLMTNHLMLLEAAELGISVTQEDIDEFVSNSKRAYELPDGKAMLDGYCAGAGITIEEYFEIIAGQAENTITRQRLRNYYGQHYCDEHGLEFTKVNPPEEMLEYIDQMLEAIHDKYADEIIYYIDLE